MPPPPVPGHQPRAVGGATGAGGILAGMPVDELPDHAAAVLDVVERIPPGLVMTYGDVAEFVGQGGPRQVGQVMARWGGSVPWWRVLKADGSPPPGLEQRALRRYRLERTPLRPGGLRVDLRRARWDGVPPASHVLPP